ncbi:MAG: enoyl-CoA hydratase-related protein [Dehalococcoidia bacterium]
MPGFEQIVYEKIGRVGRVTLNRPRYRNAQSRVLREEMDAAFAEAVADDGVRVIVLAGAGDHFSSGHDLGSPEEQADGRLRPYPPGVRGQYERTWNLNVENSLRWRELPKPTIAQVQGYCIFGGWIIASAMDLIVAADDAKFVPGLFQYFSVPWDLGARKAKEILWRAKLLDAAEALVLGLVNSVVPRERLEAETLELAESIADTDPFLARMIKFSVNQAQDAMGFRTSIQAAHANFMLNSLNGGLGQPSREPGKRKRLPAVARILEKGAPNSAAGEGQTADR